MTAGLVDFLSRALDSEEREAVLGDLAEKNMSGPQAFRDILGLVVRRQAIQCRRPAAWLTLALLVVPFALLFGIAAARLADSGAFDLWIYAHHGSRKRPGFSGGEKLLAGLALMCCSWTVGVAARVLAPRTAPSSGFLLCSIAIAAGLLYGPPYLPGIAPAYSLWVPVIVPTVLVVLPALCGLRSAVRSGNRYGRISNLAAVVTVALMALYYAASITHWDASAGWELWDVVDLAPHRYFVLALYWPVLVWITVPLRRPGRTVRP